jgi:CheY-like chemotaxis protein
MVQEAKDLDFVLIDDNEIDLFLHERVLRLQGISSRVYPFSAASKALTYLETFREHVDAYPETVILLDLMMPEMDGFDFLDHFENFPTELKKKTRIFIVSSSLDFGDMSRCEAHQRIERTLNKPLLADDLRVALREIAFP